MTERTPLHDLSRDELIGPILQKQSTDFEKRNAEPAARNEQLVRRIEELEKKNPAVRLDEAFSNRTSATDAAERKEDSHLFSRQILCRGACRP